jgi:hypothetical protein
MTITKTVVASSLNYVNIEASIMADHRPAHDLVTFKMKKLHLTAKHMTLTIHLVYFVI